MARYLELTDDETIFLRMFLRMTTRYRADELESCKQLSAEKNEDGSLRFPNMEGNAYWWECAIDITESVLRKLDNAQTSARDVGDYPIHSRVIPPMRVKIPAPPPKRE